ncbi:MAG: NAD(P)H-dependent oxidoreductase [Apibacter sp.]|jgi:putative NADPH-quinone reductase|nr:NAD(P)H-dependent oxidoreductase [Apibacter sp.]
MKTLVIIGHPDLSNSTINKRWVKEIEKYPEMFTVHSLYNTYPNYSIDVEKEQKLIEQHENIILQYPLYWFNCPALLKKWIDDVFTYGWAYGSKGDKMKDKKIALAISAGSKEENYKKDRNYSVTIDDLILPFKITSDYMNSNFKGYFILYGTNSIRTDALEKSAEQYISFIKKL